jgi:hypothetical protein
MNMTRLRLLLIAALLPGCFTDTTSSPEGDEGTLVDPAGRPSPSGDEPGSEAEDPGRAPVPADPEEELPGQGQPCADGQCAPGLACLQYYGIAGPRGGLFTSCEIRCGATSDCPEAQQCITIADGPGQVCRPEVEP